MNGVKRPIIGIVVVFLAPLALAGSTQLASQPDWNLGQFKGTTADRQDNSGILGIGYENGTQKDSLKGLWRLDKSSGDIFDYSGEGNNGDVYGADRTMSGILGTGATDFEGSADEIVIPDDSSLDLSEGFTLNVWIKANEVLDVKPSMSSNPEIFSKGNSYSLTIQNENYIAFSQNSNLKLMNSTGHITNLGVDTNVIGPLSDYDQDNLIEIPYVDNSGNLKIIDKKSNSNNLASGAKTSSSTLAAGDLDNDGRKEIYYIDSSSSTIYEYDFGDGTSNQVDTGISSTAISGVADYDGDGNKDLIFLDSSQTISWYNGSSVQSTGKSIAGANNYKYWIGGTKGPEVGKYESSWTDLSGNNNAPTNSIYSGAYNSKAFYLGGGSGEVTRWDGSFSEITGFPYTSKVYTMSSNTTHLLASSGSSIATYNTKSNSWSKHGGIKSNPTFYASANSYGSSQTGDYWLLGHAQTGGTPKAYVTKFDGNSFTRLSDNVFSNTVKAMAFNGTHFLVGDSTGNLGIYDGSGWTTPKSNTITSSGNSIYAIEWGSINGDSFWLVGGGSGKIVKIQENGSTTYLGKPTGNSIRSIEYSSDSEKFFIGDSSGNVIRYNSSGLAQTGNSIFGNSLRTLLYNPTSSRKKLGPPSDLDNDGEIEVPIVTDGSNLALVPASGSTNVIDSSYGNAKASPLGTVDWNGDPSEEIIHINSNSDTLYLSDISGNEQSVTKSDGTQVTGVEQSPGISAGSMPQGIPVLKINGQKVLNRGGQPLRPESWTMVTAKYNASTGLAELYFNSTLIDSKTTGLGTVNPNSKDFKIANGKLNATIDEVKAYNESLSSSKIDKLFFNGTDGRFDGAYNSTTVNPEGKKSWNNFTLNANITADTSVSGTIYSLDGSNNVLNTKSISVNNGKQNYSISGLQNSKKIKFSFDGYSTDIRETWEIFKTKIYYQDSFKVGNVTHDDYSNQHKFNISATARGADSDNQITGCTAYYSTETLLPDYYSIGSSFSESYGGSKTVSCNATISTDLRTVGYGSNKYEQVSFKFNFTDKDGYTVSTVNQTETLPNNQPTIQGTNQEISSIDHKFNFSAVANDQDGDGDITSCTIYAEDNDGNQHTLNGLTTSYGNSTQVSCNATVSSSLSGLQVGEDIQVHAEFTDVADATASTAIYTQSIPNHDPVITSGPTLEKRSGEHDFNVSAVAYDSDSGSSEISSCTVYAEDGDGNTKVISGSSIVDQSFGSTDEASCNTSVSNSVNGFTVGESITVNVKFSDKHGVETGNVTGTKTIPNTAPDLPKDLNMSYFLDSGADLRHVLDHTPEINWTNPTDPENDNISIKAYTESSSNPNQLDAEVDKPETKLALGQNISLSDGKAYNVSLRACDPYSCSSYTENIEFTMNQEPVIQSVSLNDSSLTGSDLVKLEANITDSMDSIPWANFTVYNQSSGELLYENNNGSRQNELWNSESFELRAGNTYNWTLETSDGYQTSKSTGTFTVSNHVPTIEKSLTSTTYEFGHKMNLSATASDPDGQVNLEKYNITLDDGDGNTYTYQRSLNKAYGSENTVAANFSNLNDSIQGFKVNEQISISITFIDKGGKTASTSGTKDIPNHLPNSPAKLNMTYFLGENEDINHVTDPTPKINWSNPSNPDNDNITIKAYTGSSSSPTTLDSSLELGSNYGKSNKTNLGQNVGLNDGTSYNVTLVACDPYGCSSRSNNLEFHMNQEPNIQNVELNNSSPTGSDIVKLEANITDNEDDISSVKFTVWNVTSGEKVLNQASGTLNQNTGEWESKKFEVFASTDYNWTVNTTDGYEHTLSSGSFKVPNTAPSMVSGPSFENYNAGHKFKVSAVASDIDGEVNFNNYTISLDDGEQVHEYTKEVNQDFGSSNEVAANFSNVNASLDGFKVGETIFVTVVFSDKAGETAENFNNHVIPNHKPNSSADFNMTYFLKSGNISRVIDHSPKINFTTPSDSDNDNITLKIFTGTASSPDTLDRKVKITSSNYGIEENTTLGKGADLNDGTSYNVAVKACDQYGSCTNKRKVTSFTMNQEPVFNSVKLNKSASNLTDGDPVHLIANITDKDEIKWANFTVWNQSASKNVFSSQNGSINENGSWISPTWKVSSGSTYNWTVEATDGYENSSQAGTFTTDNANPETVSGPTFDTISGEHAFNVSAVIKDPDGDSDLANYTITYEDGDGNSYSKQRSFTNFDFGTPNEAAINYSINSSIQGFKVGESITVQISFQDDAQASGETPTASKEIPNDVPGQPTNLNMSYFLESGADLGHVLDHSPEINWTTPTDAENDNITIKAFTGSNSDPTTLDNSISSGNNLSLGKNVELLDGETFNVTLQACDPYGCSSKTENIEFTMNQEPRIESVEINDSSLTGSDKIKLIANITSKTDATKWTNFTVYNQTSGEILFQNKQGAQNTEDDWVSPTWTTRASTTYNYTIKTTDGYETSNTTGTISIGNQQPALSSISFENFNKGHKFNVSAVATDEDGAVNIDKFNITLSDGDGNTEEIETSINQNFGTKNEVALNYSNVNDSIAGFTPEETITVDVEVIDKGGLSSSNSRENTIPNHKPSQISNLDLEVANKSYVVKHDFRINFTNPSDSDNDNITIKAYLGTDADPLTVDNSTEISSKSYNSKEHLIVGNNVNLQDNQDYNLDIVACDNWGCTSRTVTESFHMNQEPRIETVEINESVSEEAEWIHLIGNVTSVDNSLEATFYDIWNQSSPQLLVDQKLTGTSGESWNSSTFYGKSLQTYNWTFTAFDSFENTTLTGVFDVGNADPTITRGIQFKNLKNEHGFNVSLRAEDINGDSDLANYTVIANDGDGNSYRYAEKFTASGDEKAWANYSSINSSIEGFKVGESITVQVIVRDQHNLKAYSSSVSKTIPNRQPVITEINLKPSNPATTEKLNVTYTVEDPENDKIVNSFYEWRGNSTTVTSKTVSPSETEENQHWNLSLQVVDEYNALSQENTSQETLVIQDSPPEIARAQEVTNISGEHAYRVSTVIRDVNGETDLQNVCTVDITDGTNTANDTTPVDTSYSGSDKARCSYEINTTKFNWISPEEQITTNFTVKDDDNEKVSTADKTATVPNRRPSVTDLETPENNSETRDTELKFDWKASDAEGDNLNYELNIYNETSLIQVNNTNTEGLTVSGLQSSQILWNVTVKDTFNGETLSSNTSSTSSILVDSKAPDLVTGPAIKVINSSRDYPKQNQSVKCYSRWSDNFDLGNAEIYENAKNTNHTISSSEFDSGWANVTIKASNLEAGQTSCSFYASDHLNNNASAGITFDVEDIEKPNITDFDYSPKSQRKLDPNEPVIVNATITDNLELENVSLLYRKEGGNWKLGNVTSSGDLYTGNFTPETDGATYEFKYKATDTYGNKISLNDSVNVSWDYTWSRTPSEYTGSSTLQNNLVDYTPIQVDNTGDFPLKYNITTRKDSNLKLDIGDREFTVPSGESKAISLEAKLKENSADDEGIYSFQIKIQSENSTANPSSEGITGQATFTLDAPFLSMEKASGFPLSVSQGTEDVKLPVYTTNVGTQAAEDASISYEIPSSWELSSGSLNQDLGNMSVDETKSSSITVSIPGDAPTGTKQVNLTAATTNRTFSQAFQIEITENDTTTIIQNRGGGGGGLVTGGGGPTNQEQVTQASDQIFNQTQSFELVRGQDQNFSITLTNPTAFNLSNITIEASGFRAQYLDLKTTYIRSLDVNETENVTVGITAPDFFASSSFTINFDISGVGYDPDAFINPYFNFTLNKKVKLEIHEISKNRAQNLTQEMQELKRQLNNSGLPAREVQEILSTARNNIDQGQYGAVQENFQQVQSIYQTATETKQGLQQLKNRIQTAQAQGLTVNQARRMANLAEEALERGAYSIAANRLEEARNLYQLETKGQVNYVYLITSNWKKILAAIIIISIISVVAYYRYKLYRINSRLTEIDQEEESIHEMKKQDQKEAFEQGEMSVDEYEDAAEDYNEDLIDLIEERTELESKKANLTNFREEDALKQQRDKIQEIIQDTQRDYVEGNIADTEMYETKVEELTEKLSTIESELAEKEAKSKHKSSWIPFR